MKITGWMKLEVSQDYKLSKQHMVADMVELKSHFLVHMFTFELVTQKWSR